VQFSRRIVILLVLAAAVGITLLGALFLRGQDHEAAWTPAPYAGARYQPGLSATVLPAERTLPVAAAAPVTGVPGPTIRPAARPIIEVSPTRPVPSRVPALAPAATRDASATADPHVVIITAADVARSLAAGAGTQNGLQADGLVVGFGSGKMRLAADRLAYGPVQVQNLVVVGTLIAKDGALQLVAESITPQGLVASLIPTMANQALGQYTSQWYVESVQILDGRMEVRIR
jgi:hypothetical protein